MSIVPHATMPLSGQPFRIVVSICSGEPPWSHAESVRFGPIRPLPSALWQGLQLLPNSARPAAIIAGSVSHASGPAGALDATLDPLTEVEGTGVGEVGGFAEGRGEHAATRAHSDRDQRIRRASSVRALLSRSDRGHGASLRPDFG